MHLIVMTDAAQGCGAPDAPRDPAPQDREALIERWSPLMLRLTPAWAISEDPDALHTLAECAAGHLMLGRALIAAEDGRLPLAAWNAMRKGQEPRWPCARLTPFHGLVGSDRITLVPPGELQLQVQESRELFTAVKPLYESEGVDIQWQGPLEWQLAHESLRGLPCASRVRAEGDSVQRWQGRTPLAAARLLRRLQNEAQMVLHEHPVNHRRAERGALTVNSLWLDHAGALGDLGGEPRDARLSQALKALHAYPLTQANTALQAWVDAALGPTPAGAVDPTLVLCGRQAAQAFTMRRVPAGWRGVFERTLRRPPRTRALKDWLRALDAAPAQQGPA